MRERDIERHLVERVRALGGEVRKVRWIGRRGAPDRLVMLPDREMLVDEHFHFAGYDIPACSFWVELKAPGAKPAPHQAREHARMRAVGQRVEVVDSIEGVEALLS